MSLAVDWSKHQARVEKCKPTMLRAMRALARSVGVPARDVIEYDGDTDYIVEFIVTRRGRPGDPEYRNRLGVKWSIWDSGEADDGIYGQHGNFVFDLVEGGGRIIGQCIPWNYSDRAWVDYDDDGEWERRLADIADGLSDAARAIREWKRDR